MSAATIVISGSEGEFAYAFPSGRPVEAPYPLPGGNFVGQVIWTEYFRFWGMVDQDLMPATADVLDVTYVDARGVVQAAEADFRAEALANRLAERGKVGASVSEVAEDFDKIEVHPVMVLVYEIDQRGKVAENIEQIHSADVQDGNLVFWTIFGHVRRDSARYGPNGGGLESWFDFSTEVDAVEMANQLSAKLDIPY